ncbi:MAG TPA: glycoside hydrolase family 19 protein [Beijerinckiaceae bacterium]|nr:glycoside hydrolase family 19 protein [Beijerinckiaceae bacterium]
MSRAAFFNAVRADFGRLSQQQVDGFNAVLDAWGDADPRFTAYALATAWHETARTMQPIKEHGGAAYFKRMYDIEGERPHVARALGNLTPGDGARFAGRGYVQLTGRANYAKAGTRVGRDLIGNPDLAMQPDIAARIMVAGMREGWFTGKRLADYFNGSVDDPRNARRIINGIDKADVIAGYHRSFLKALQAAGRPVQPHAPVPPPPDIPRPEPAPAANPGGFWAWLKSLFT